MIVRMTHPKHGATHVYEKAELERHKQLGWTEEQTPPQSGVSVSEPKKRGRPKKVEA